MSAWRLVTIELHERGPLRVSQLMTDDAPAALQQASARGLVQRASQRRWCVTELGMAFATRRIAFRVPFIGGVAHRQKGAVLQPMATWLRPLPYPNEVRLSQASPPSARDDGFTDELIGELLAQAGHEPEAAVTAPVLRTYTTLVAQKAVQR